MASQESIGQLVCPGYEDLGIPALYVHDLTGTEDADRLLSKPPHIHPATPDVLPNLRKWNPEVASTISEKDSAVKGIPFKLVTKHQIWNSTATNSFLAVSYCWHNDQWAVPSRFSYAPEDWSLPVSPAMLSALLCCVEDEEGIWIDQLSIDQNNLRQKAHAVANMDTIYRNASRVLILLEDFDIGSDVEETLNLLAGTPNEPGNITGERIYVSRTAFAENFSTFFVQDVMETLYAFIEKVFDNCRWFERAWCHQEYQLNAGRLFIFVGHTHSCIALPSQFFMDFEAESVEAGGDENHDLYLHPQFQTFTSGIGLNNPDEISQLNLPLLFVELSELSCSYFRDIVSIALNTSGLFLSFNADIKDRSDCQFILGLILLSTGYSMVLDSIGLPLYKWPAPSHQGVMRWPLGGDFRFFANDLGLARLFPSPRFGHIRRDSMALDVFFLHCWPRAPTKGSLGIAEAWWTTLKAPPMLTDVGVATLGTALDVGLSWMLQNIRNFDEKTPLRRRRTERNSMGGTNDLLAKVDTVRPYVVRKADDMKEVANLIWDLLYSFRNIERTFPLIAGLNDEKARYAIMFVPSRLEQQIHSSTARFTFAVPAALNNPTAARVRRLWILEKAKTSDSAWSLIGQGYYFGEELRVVGDITYAVDVTVVGRWNNDVDSYDSAEEWSDFPQEVNDIYDIKWDSNGSRL